MEKLTLEALFQEKPPDYIQIGTILTSCRIEVMRGDYRRLSLADYILFSHRLQVNVRLQKRRGCIVRKLIAMDSMLKLLKPKSQHTPSKESLFSHTTPSDTTPKQDSEETWILSLVK